MLSQSQYVNYDLQGRIILPNIKKIFIPDVGKEIADADLSGADAMIYGADSECKKLMDFFENPTKFHKSGKLYAWIGSEHLQKYIDADSPEYKSYKATHHGVWYGAKYAKIAQVLSCSETKARDLTNFYDFIYPEKAKWHERLNKEVRNKGYISNIFGRRRWFLNKNDKTLENKIFAFKPSSTVADVINRGWINIREQYPDIDILLQVHDSLVMQYNIDKAEEYRPKILKAMEVPLDYNPPIIIPVDMKVSLTSYGDCEKIKIKT